jgi:hypothetical protein
MLGTFKVNQGVTLKLSFFDEDGTTPKDPSEFAAKVRHPDATVDVFAKADFTNDDVGVYTKVVVPDAPGRWYVVADGADADSPVDEDYFLVEETAFA